MIEDITEDKKDAKSLALHRLTVREYSAIEMSRYLSRKGFAGEQVAQVVAELKEGGMIDDLRYARVIARDQSFKDKGPMTVLMKLRSKGVRIDLSEVRRILDDVTGSSEVDAAKRVLERRFPEALNPGADVKDRNRAYQALLRRGFSREVIARILVN